MVKETTLEDAVLKQVEHLGDEMLAFLRELVRIPTTNPPGENYRACAEFLGAHLKRFGYDVQQIAAEGLPEHTSEHPRLNVLGRREESPQGKTLHFNGHIDVVPPGAGWSVDPFEGIVREGKIIGRGTTDQKAGIAASLYAIEALRRCGIRLGGTIEQSGTADEESGGFAGVGYLVHKGYITPEKTDFVIITEPLNVDRVCLGHRGVYWFRVRTTGRTAHGSMPFLGVSAINLMNEFIQAINSDMEGRSAGVRTLMPVTPPEARRPTLNINSIAGGQRDNSLHTPCVADSCTAVFDRRFLPEESFAEVKGSVMDLLEQLRRSVSGFEFDLEDLMVVHPVLTPTDSPLVQAVGRSIEDVFGRPGDLIASPGTYDQKHIVSAGRIRDCIAYGPGMLEMAHRPDEFCRIEDLIRGAQVMALSAMRLLGVVA